MRARRRQKRTEEPAQERRHEQERTAKVTDEEARCLDEGASGLEEEPEAQELCEL